MRIRKILISCVVFGLCTALAGLWIVGVLSHKQSEREKSDEEARVAQLSQRMDNCRKAPRDNQGSVQILNSWCANRSSLGDVAAWMHSNDNPAGHNACAVHRIDQNSLEYHYFSRTEHSVFGQHIFNSYKLTSEIIEVAK